VGNCWLLGIDLKIELFLCILQNLGLRQGFRHGKFRSKFGSNFYTKRVLSKVQFLCKLLSLLLEGTLGVYPNVYHRAIFSKKFLSQNIYKNSMNTLTAPDPPIDMDIICEKRKKKFTDPKSNTKSSEIIKNQSHDINYFHGILIHKM